jgi:hypothetical protein
MAQGRANLGKIQLGRETTPGTSVAATTVWRGAASSIEDQRVVNYVEEMVGILGGTNRSYISELLAGIKLEQTELTFEQFQYILAMAFGGPVSGSADGAGTDFIYTTNVPTTSTASMTGRTFSVRGGDDAEVELMEYGFAAEFSLKVAIREAWKIEASIIGRQAAVSSFTGAIGLPVVTEALAGGTKVYLNAVSGDYGDTQVSSQVVGAEIKIKTGLYPQFTLDGQLYFTTILRSDPEITGKLTFLHDTAALGAAGEKLNWRNETPRLLQIKIQSPVAVGTPGTTYTYPSIIVNLPIKWDKFSALERKEGGSMVTGEFTSKYDETKDDAGAFIVVNEISTLA